LKIVSMTRPDLDILIQFCMAEQFRQIQAKAISLGSVLVPKQENTKTAKTHGGESDEKRFDHGDS